MYIDTKPPLEGSKDIILIGSEFPTDENGNRKSIIHVLKVRKNIL